MPSPLGEATIDEEIASDWASILEKHAVEPEAPAVEDKTPEPVVEEAKPVDTRARDEQGKFAKVDKVEKELPKKDTSAPAVESASPGDQSAEAAANTRPDIDSHGQPQRDINRPPSTWKPQVRTEWDKLPPTVKAEIHRREADFQNGHAQLLPDARLGSEIKRATEPYRMLIESNYGTPEKAMTAFLQTAAALQMGSPSQKLQTIVGLSQQFGVDLSALQSGTPQPQQPLGDPRVDQLLMQMRQRDEQSQAAEQRQLETLANTWMSEADAQGNPKRPYIGDVIQEMSMLIPQIKQTNPHLTHAQILESAYDRAVWANPDTRAALQGAQHSELQAKAAAENQARVAQAKRAASVNVPRRASTPSPAKPGSMDETLMATARELGLFS